MAADIMFLTFLGLLRAAPQLLAAKLRGSTTAYVVAAIWLGFSIIAASQFRIHAPIHFIPFWAGWAAGLLALLLFYPLQLGKAEQE